MSRAFLSALSAGLVLVGATTGCGDDDRPTGFDAGPGPVDGGGAAADAGPAVDAGPGTDAGPGADAGGTDAGPPMSDAGPLDAGPPPAPCTTGAIHTYVLSVIDIGQADPAGDPDVVPGFDLDGRVSDDTDALGCFHPDFTSPAPDSLTGVDNQMGPVLGALSGSIDVSAELAAGIASGQLLILARVSGVDDFVTDSCVDVEVMTGLLPAGVTMPALGSSGRLTPGQTFDIDAASLMADRLTPLVRFPRAEIISGRVRGTSTTPWVIDVPTATGGLRMTLMRPVTRFDITSANISRGVLAGALDTDDLAAALVMLDPTLPGGIVRAVLDAQADLSPDSAGLCQAISVGLVFDGVSAVEGLVR